ncbi:serine hydrolase [Hymenobacter sp. BRD128]|uniref:serine hydrolase domain-containing protein n=1 Tax=Hymenobacter sp. BRD128 TaxID=2675878 RepID=UPI0015679AC9|nr:serine hydrolase domain-containing protein [Hymenobacter sp. BRD128]QKG55683.1 serine hydrolase [Hymenobacter sp. BRD128]
MMHRPTLALASLLSLGYLAAPAQTLNTIKLDSLLDGLASHNKLMGSLALSHDGQVVYSHAFGAAQLAPLVAATPATHYRIGSISKVFTGVLIFQLIEEKKLTLDTKLATFFPQVPNADRITIDQLLSHRSGIHNFTDDPAYISYMTRPQTQAELLAIMAQPKPDFEPGAKYAYSNSNFVLLGYIVEKLTKIPYAQALQKHILTKAGLKNTYYGGKIDPQKQQALSYGPSGSGWKLSPETDMSIPAGAGALVSTPTDLDHFLEALFGGKLLSASSLVAMQNIRDGYGRALMQVPFGAKKGYGHTGGIDAFRSAAFYFPGDKLAVALCTNGGSYSPNEVLIGALSLYFGQPYKLPDFTPSTYALTPADLDRYAGTYASPTMPLKIMVSRDGATLRAQATGQNAFPLEPVSAGIFKFDPAGIRMEFDPAKPAFTLRQGGGTFLFTKE